MSRKDEKSDAPAFADAIQKIDTHLRDEMERLETTPQTWFGTA